MKILSGNFFKKTGRVVTLNRETIDFNVNYQLLLESVVVLCADTLVRTTGPKCAHSLELRRLTGIDSLEDRWLTKACLMINMAFTLPDTAMHA